MATKTYDPGALQLIVNGTPASGYAEDSVVTVKRDEKLFEKQVGVDGEVSRTKNVGKTGTVELSLHQTSTFNLVLSAMALADQETGAGIGPFLLREGNTIIAAGECWVEELPEVEYKKKAGERKWTLALGNCSVFNVGGNT